MTSPIKNPDVILSVDDLSVEFLSKGQTVRAVDHVSFELLKRETLGIVGESGSGKSVTALSVMRLIRTPPGEIKSGTITYRPEEGETYDLLSADGKVLRNLRGNRISMIFQEPMTSLNPVYTCGDQVREAVMLHQHLPAGEAREKTLKLFHEVQLANPEKIFRSYPHEISGGQKQRVMIAMAMSCEPDILIADEPTTALDVTVQAGILKIMERLREEYDMSVIFITHDLGVIGEIADRVLVMYKGKIVEQGSIFEIFANPKHPYTKGLIACRPRLNVRLKRLPMVSDFIRESEEGTLTVSPQYNSVGQAILFNAEPTDEVVRKRLKVIGGGPLLEVRNLKTWFYGSSRFGSKDRTITRAVDDVSFVVYPGETLGLVGESGCGKTTLGRSILRLTEPLSGEIYFEGNAVHDMNKRELRELRKKMQIIFQDPYASLNPRLTIGQAIMEPMTAAGMYAGKGERKKRARELMDKVGLDPKYFNRYPHEFSGGQRQRASIARALAPNPRFIICDESVSALDVSVQAQVLNLLNDLKAEFDFTYIFISHDLSVVKFMADRILVMLNGKLIEMGFPDALFERPKEEYTRKLINAIPRGEISDIRKAQLRRRLVAARKSLFS